MDRFGKDTRLRPVDSGHFAVRVTVAVSGQFFGWLAGLGNGVRLDGPQEVTDAYLAHLQGITAAYKRAEQ